MNQNLITQALELQKHGLSIRQIAGELNVSKSQVFRWLNGQSGNGGNTLPIDQIAISTNTPQSLKHKNQNNMENNNDLNKLEREIALKKLQLEHELEMRKLAQQDKELELRKRELELKHLEKDAISRQQQIEEADHALTDDLFGSIDNKPRGAKGAAGSASDVLVLKD